MSYPGVLTAQPQRHSLWGPHILSLVVTQRVEEASPLGVEARTVPLLVPEGWRVMENPQGPDDTVIYLRQRKGMTVGISETIHLDGHTWRQVSMSFPDRMPTYAEIVSVKQAFVGDDFPAYEVFPPREEWVNLYEFCRHLWSPRDPGYRPLPDFRRGGGI